jgi:hypothetical protein
VPVAPIFLFGNRNNRIGSVNHASYFGLSR